MKYRLKKRYQQTRKHKSSGKSSHADLCSKNFYHCVNAHWLRSVRVPPYLSAFGVSEEIEKRIESELFEIAYKCHDTYRKKPEPPKTIESMIGAVVHSVLTTPVQEKNVAFVRGLLAKLECSRTLDDIASSMGDMCRHRISSCIEIDGKYFDENKKQYTLSIRRGTIGLPDRLYYQDTSPGRWKTLHYYQEYLQSLGKAFSIPRLESIISIEKELAPYILMKQMKEKEMLLYGNQLETLYRQFPWNSFFQAFGLENWKSRVFAVESKEWLGILNTLCKEKHLENWKLLLQSQLLHHFVAYLPPPYDDYHYEFYRKRLRGQAQKLPQKYLMLEVLTNWYTPFMSHMFQELIDPSLKTRAKAFAETIRGAAAHRLLSVDWLAPHTRELAKKKVETMLVSIAYPDQKERLPLPETNAECLVENLLYIGRWKTEKLLARLGTTRKDEKGWEDPIYAVNGYYYSDDNELIIPTGSLYSPFYDERKPLGWNYGGVGVIMAHEITHAFDEEGKEYDPTGYRKPWWTSQDKKNYEKVSKKLVDLFHMQRVMGQKVDGESTLSENIADLGGLAIGLDALNLELEKQKASLTERKNAYRQFFISYAVSWRIKEKPEKQLQGLLVDRHAPTPLRVNLVVNQFQEWYDAFDVRPEDPMYVAPEKRLRIF